MWILYILLGDKDFFYVGITGNIEKRLKRHRGRYEIYTKRFKEIDLVYKEYYDFRADAESREKQIKGWSREKKKALIAGDIDKLKELSKSK
ncbi:hypothetical protein CO178_02015 [candidate division WWE3 bacterium CG_4_9_14_3_um_filter_34_6]|uniref:GIY-YIG domain-containing protein n=1 Tax=candidate division WWE3 bacterium CG_4_9_14_3_um_filter_34_6 TaxID=1975079 RepID=A0A2M7X3L2_UNCKA|nr:MAG: hypothetical protein CO178_02015 [candidate division WWE3 bacterium CG_4_9_14_3_um_filter_34_6]